MSAGKREINALAKRLGATVDYRPDREAQEHEIVADAPDGHVWSGSAVHQLVVCGDHGTPWADLYADMHDRMADGVEPCGDPECETCHPADEPPYTPTVKADASVEDILAAWRKL